MRFTLPALVALVGTAAAAPSFRANDPNSYENVDVNDFTVFEKDGCSSASFSIQIGNKKHNCSVKDVKLPMKKFATCDDSSYSFRLAEGKESSSYAVTIDHLRHDGACYGGELDIPTYCRAGGLGRTICTPPPNNFFTVVITGN